MLLALKASAKTIGTMLFKFEKIQSFKLFQNQNRLETAVLKILKIKPKFILKLYVV